MRHALCCVCGAGFVAITQANALGQLADHLMVKHTLTLAEHAVLYVVRDEEERDIEAERDDAETRRWEERYEREKVGLWE